jgi:hypothetical protein
MQPFGPLGRNQWQRNIKKAFEHCARWCEERDLATRKTQSLLKRKSITDDYQCQSSKVAAIVKSSALSLIL